MLLLLLPPPLLLLLPVPPAAATANRRIFLRSLPQRTRLLRAFACTRRRLLPTLFMYQLHAGRWQHRTRQLKGRGKAAAARHHACESSIEFSSTAAQHLLTALLNSHHRSVSASRS
jgi:hypothetical protein